MVRIILKSSEQLYLHPLKLLRWYFERIFSGIIEGHGYVKSNCLGSKDDQLEYFVQESEDVPENKANIVLQTGCAKVVMESAIALLHTHLEVFLCLDFGYLSVSSPSEVLPLIKRVFTNIKSAMRIWLIHSLKLTLIVSHPGSEISRLSWEGELNFDEDISRCVSQIATALNYQPNFESNNHHFLPSLNRIIDGVLFAKKSSTDQSSGLVILITSGVLSVEYELIAHKLQQHCLGFNVLINTAWSSNALGVIPEYEKLRMIADISPSGSFFVLDDILGLESVDFKDIFLIPIIRLRPTSSHEGGNKDRVGSVSPSQVGATDHIMVRKLRSYHVDSSNPSLVDILLAKRLSDGFHVADVKYHKQTIAGDVSSGRLASSYLVTFVFERYLSGTCDLIYEISFRMRYVLFQTGPGHSSTVEQTALGTAQPPGLQAPGQTLPGNDIDSTNDLGAFTVDRDASSSFPPAQVPSCVLTKSVINVCVYYRHRTYSETVWSAEGVVPAEIQAMGRELFLTDKLTTKIISPSFLTELAGKTTTRPAIGAPTQKYSSEGNGSGAQVHGSSHPGVTSEGLGRPWRAEGGPGMRGGDDDVVRGRYHRSIQAYVHLLRGLCMTDTHQKAHLYIYPSLQSECGDESFGRGAGPVGAGHGPGRDPRTGAVPQLSDLPEFASQVHLISKYLFTEYEPHYLGRLQWLFTTPSPSTSSITKRSASTASVHSQHGAVIGSSSSQRPPPSSLLSSAHSAPASTEGDFLVIDLVQSTCTSFLTVHFYFLSTRTSPAETDTVTDSVLDFIEQIQSLLRSLGFSAALLRRDLEPLLLQPRHADPCPSKSFAWNYLRQCHSKVERNYCSSLFPLALFKELVYSKRGTGFQILSASEASVHMFACVLADEDSDNRLETLVQYRLTVTDEDLLCCEYFVEPKYEAYLGPSILDKDGASPNGIRSAMGNVIAWESEILELYRTCDSLSVLSDSNLTRDLDDNSVYSYRPSVADSGTEGDPETIAESDPRSCIVADQPTSQRMSSRYRNSSLESLNEVLRTSLEPASVRTQAQVDERGTDRRRNLSADSSQSGLFLAGDLPPAEKPRLTSDRRSQSYSTIHVAPSEAVQSPGQAIGRSVNKSVATVSLKAWDELRTLGAVSSNTLPLPCFSTDSDQDCNVILKRSLDQYLTTLGAVPVDLVDVPSQDRTQRHFCTCDRMCLLIEYNVDWKGDEIMPEALVAEEGAGESKLSDCGVLPGATSFIYLRVWTIVLPCYKFNGMVGFVGGLNNRQSVGEKNVDGVAGDGDFSYVSGLKRQVRLPNCYPDQPSFG